MPPLTDRDVLRYIKLEEDDATRELLIPGSVRYVGALQTPSGIAHYWSYPTGKGVGWAELGATISLGFCGTPPEPISAATQPRNKHKFRNVARRPPEVPLAKRVKPDRATWVEPSAMPTCSLHQAWHQHASFESAVKYYGARAIRDGSAGPGTRYFHLQLTSGRYACIESRRDFPQTVAISLEVNTRKASKNSGGVIYVRDIEEILGPLGGTFKMPTANLFIAWSADA
jgi:hypothetical protein